MKRRSKTIHNVGVFLIDENNRLLVVHQNRGFNPPGGRVEYYDFDYFAAAEREFEEETNSKLPLPQHQFDSCVYRHRARCAMLFYNTKRITKSKCDDIIKQYNRNGIKDYETDDLAFVPIDRIVNNHRSVVVTGLKYSVKDKIAGFVPRVMKFLIRNAQ